MQFDQQVILVTGASRGLGKAFARFMAAAGATVAVNSTGKDPRGRQSTDDIANGWAHVVNFSEPEYPNDMREALVSCQVNSVIYDASHKLCG